MAERAPYPGAPRWVKVSGIIGIVVVLLIGILMFAGGGNHGPNRHLPSADSGSPMAPSTINGDDSLSGDIADRTTPTEHGGQRP